MLLLELPAALKKQKESKKMFHENFRGNHYEAGFQWGAQLLRSGRKLPEGLPFEDLKEREARKKF